MNNIFEHFTIEAEAFEGVKRIAHKVAKDFEKVGGTLPDMSVTLPPGQNTIVFATLGKSPLVDKLIGEGKFDASAIRGKREVYQIKLLGNVLLICGSDKRGTIYGMFALSEFIGVSPLCFWGDVEPLKRDKIEITQAIEMVSKEPSIKYRGFFINDERPCFDSWTCSHFGGFTAEMYDHVFELLLRLKGNYLWPAMWISSFALDGPGSASEELADIYGVIMGASHHEPCLRASEEWDKFRGPDSVYGNEWNYYTNKGGLLRYWEDGLKRSGKYEKLITIGMRGEQDSSMLGENATVKDNVELLKDIIKNQRALIKKHVNENLDEVPQLIASYKEVEEYFYGGDEVQGLKDWDELDGVICMLCEDNFGFMRTLPTADTRGRQGGYGMYYHFDYHGGPVSYEWMPSTSFERTWEQMCMAYDYGIRDVWIVNVGDIKFNEVSLAYFMELAYDFERWGTNSPNSTGEYTLLWLEKTFPALNDTERTALCEKMAQVLSGYITINAMRRPEAQNAETYHPCHYLEADRMLSLAKTIETLNEEIYSQLDGVAQDAYYSMIYFPAKISLNLFKMNLYAGKNHHYAKQGKKIANQYTALVSECIEKDRALCTELARFRGGKWKGMELGQHIGFVKWNDDNCRYPLRMQVEPAQKPRMVVSRKDSAEIMSKKYGSPMVIKIDDFLYAGNDEVILEIANDGIGSIKFTIEAEHQYEWLEISQTKGQVEFQQEVIVRCNRVKLTKEPQKAQLFIKDGETVVAVEIAARNINTQNLPPMTFSENNGVIAMEANHFCAAHNTVKGSFAELKPYGRSGAGMKVFPTTAAFGETDEKPTLSYRFTIREAGNYAAEIWTTPVNPVQNKRPLRFMLTDSAGRDQVITAVPSDFKAGSSSDERWCEGVLDNIRISRAEIHLDSGLCEISIGALEAGLILERILIYREGTSIPVSYLGPPESFYTV